MTSWIFMSGWQRRRKLRVRVILLLAFVLLMQANLLPAEEKKETTQQPSEELLEFLGNWETEQGEWIDPEELKEMVIPDQGDKKDEVKQK